jgi:gamma-glutamylcyclotransferase (GGCT)/AIG2-like uncharacterized protein YtfP
MKESKMARASAVVYIFGYGTMRSDTPDGSVPDGKSIGFGHVDGQLWTIRNEYGTWAGVREGEGRVFGEIFEVGRTALKKLDYRERVHEGHYVRKLVKAWVYGRELDVYVYFAGDSAELVEQVASGNWALR